MIEYFYFRRFI